MLANAGAQFGFDQQPPTAEAICELESTGPKSTGICPGYMAADRHSIAGFEVEHHDVVSNQNM